MRECGRAATKAAAGLRYAASRALIKIRCVDLNLHSLVIIRALENNMTKICKWGNSLGLRLPKETAANVESPVGTRVRVRLLDNGSIIVTHLGAVAAMTEGQTVTTTLKAKAKW